MKKPKKGKKVKGYCAMIKIIERMKGSKAICPYSYSEYPILDGYRLGLCKKPQKCKVY